MFPHLNLHLQALPKDKTLSCYYDLWRYYIAFFHLNLKFNRVIHKVARLGIENGQFRHNRAGNAQLGMKILQNEITVTQTSFPTNFGGKLSFILSFLFPQPQLLLHISSLLLPVQLL